jgi:hypothetical protein
MISERYSGFSGVVLQFVECADFRSLCRFSVFKVAFSLPNPEIVTQPEPSKQKDALNSSIYPLHHLPFDRPPRFFSFAKQFNIKDETIFSYVSNLDGGATRVGR